MKKIFYTAKNLVSPETQVTDFVELFFDLVFVYAITMITSSLEHSLDMSHLLESFVIFWMIWWGWTQFTWTLNAANTSVPRVRMMILIATGVAFIMASSVGEAFGLGVMWFSIPYVVVRIIGIVIYFRVTVNTKTPRARIELLAIPHLIGFIAIIVGSLLDPSIRIWCWFGAIVLDMLGSSLASRSEGQILNLSHFAERHGLIVIIAIGESLIVAAHAISSQEKSQELIIVGSLTVLITCLLWWSYFSWIKEYFEVHLAKKSGKKQITDAVKVYSILHFPLICGIIGIAVGFGKILGHPHDLLTPPVAIALSGGYFFFIGSTALSVWRLNGLILLPRIITLIISTISVYFTVGHPAYFNLSIIAISLILITTFEWKYNSM